MSSASQPWPADGRVVWITGAAGGLGQGLTHEFLRQGWRVAATGHRRPIASESERLWGSSLDVTQSAAVDQTVAEILARWGRLDALVNNAGVIADQLSWQISEADWDRVVSVNLTGAFHCARAALPPMLQQSRGHIVNVSSFAGRCGARGQANYAAAKAGLIGFGASLAREVGAGNVCVNTVLPGVLPTPMIADLEAKQKTALIEANVLGRINSIGEVARFIAFLVQMENVSGQLFQLDSRIGPWT